MNGSRHFAACTRAFGLSSGDLIDVPAASVQLYLASRCATQRRSHRGPARRWEKPQQKNKHKARMRLLLRADARARLVSLSVSPHVYLGVNRRRKNIRRNAYHRWLFCPLTLGSVASYIRLPVARRIECEATTRTFWVRATSKVRVS